MIDTLHIGCKFQLCFVKNQKMTAKTVWRREKMSPDKRLMNVKQDLEIEKIVSLRNKKNYQIKLNFCIQLILSLRMLL